ncbi:MAG: hypothetical protein QW117_01795 [Candidatus Pacearchaeota archaeon]
MLFKKFLGITKEMEISCLEGLISRLEHNPNDKKLIDRIRIGLNECKRDYGIESISYYEKKYYEILKNLIEKNEK